MGENLDKKPKKANIITRKYFEKSDIFVYVFLFILLLFLFLFFILGRTDNSQGFKAELDGEIVLSHVYGEEFKINEQFKDKIEIQSDKENYTVKFLFGEGYNILFVDEKDKSVKMRDSDCPSKNCVHMQKIKDAGAIYCAPRELKITPLYDNEFISPTTGGN